MNYLKTGALGTAERHADLPRLTCANRHAAGGMD